MASAAMFAASLVVSGCSDDQSAATRIDAADPHGLTPVVVSVDSLSIIPSPAAIDPGQGAFLVSDATRVEVSSYDTEAIRIAEYFVDLMARTTRFNFELTVLDPEEGGQGGIAFRTGTTATEAKVSDAYQLVVADDGVSLGAGEGAGLFNAATTLWQILTSVESEGAAIELPALTIMDTPRYAWRGLLLDSARHYQSTDYIKQFIDWMAVHKFNVFHWHLIDDQAWRLEIKKYPRLTDVGAYRVQAGEAARMDIDPMTGNPRLYGGFYSQEEVRDIVAYAAERYITVVPEIEMPGHAQALLVAYPEYGVTGEEIELRTDWGIYPHLYNVEEETFAFIEDVLDEVMALFPGTYIHIGGDEAVKDQWRESARIQERMRELGVDTEEELQSYFIHRIEAFLNENNRKLVGWDEILEGGLSPNATVMSWRGEAGGIEAAKEGHDVVMTPGPLLYFDFEQSSLRDEPPGRPAPNVQTLEDIYVYNPRPDELTDEEAKHILGIQANIWTEHMRLQERVTHMSFPRASAVSEIAWTDGETKDFNEFLKRLAVQFQRYEALGLAYADSAFQVDVGADRTAGDNLIRVRLENQTGFGEIRYTLDGSEPTLSSPRFDMPFEQSPPITIRANAFHDGRALADTVERTFTVESIDRREDDDLKMCSEGLVLRLEDDGPVRGERAVYNVDIFNPCWIYESARLDDVTGMRFSIGQIPFNFQVGDAVNGITHPEPETAAGELIVRRDTCEGAIIARLPLAGLDGIGLETIEGDIEPHTGEHDLCFQFASAEIDPFWVIDWVQPLRGGQNPS